MKTKLVMVASVDGKTTKWGTESISEWTSKEDKEYFSKILSESNLIIMGRKTFEAIEPKIKRDGKLRIVITSEPIKYRNLEVKDHLEFSSSSPKEILAEAKGRGYKDVTLVGGGETNAGFLKSGLIDEIWLTIEPKIFGEGKDLFVGQFETELELIGINKLNGKGTLLAKYRVV